MARRFIPCFVALFACGSAAAASPVRLEKFAPGCVVVGGEIGRRMDVTIDKMLHHTDVDAVFARHFRDRKEKPDEPGGFAGYGMFLDALVKAAAHGIGGEETVALKKRLLAELAATQTQDGQITMFLRGPGVWDFHENAYMIQAYVRDWLWSGEESSLATARRLADSLVERKAPASIGTETAFNLVYEAAHEKRYLDYLNEVCFMDDPEPFTTYDRKTPVNGVQHVYTWIARAIAQMEYADMLGRTTPADRARYGVPAYEALRRAHGPYLSISGSITGTAHWAELWDASQIGLGQWGETCASAYLMRLCARMSEWDGESGNFDLYERVMHNAFFSAQSEDGLKYRYFTPFNKRADWWNRDTYCCPNNFKRMVFEIPDSVFCRAGDGLAVCLYTPAELKAKGVEAKMDTLYPEDGKVVLDVKMSPGVKSLYLRIPKWCPSATVAVGGETKSACPGWFEVRRDFSDGVRVTLDMPMKIRLVRGYRAQEGRVAVMRGPCVFSLVPEQNGLKAGGYIDMWDIDASRPMTWNPERHGVELTLQLRQRARTAKDALLTRYFKEDKVRTYFETVESCAACDDEIAPNRTTPSPGKY